MATALRATGRALRQSAPSWRSRGQVFSSRISFNNQSERRAATSAVHGTHAVKVQNFLYGRGEDDIVSSPFRFEHKGKTVYVSSAWLRDLCNCPACVDPSSKQKRFATTDIPKNVTARLESLDSNGMTLVWINDIPGSPPEHKTFLSAEVLEAILTGTRNPIFASRYERVRWHGAHLPTISDLDFTYQEYMQDDSVVLRALAQLDSYGLMFINGVPEDEHAINGLVERIGPLKNTFYGLTWDVRSVPEAKNVAYTSGDLDFHMDLMYVQDPPALQFLHCIRTSAKGGASRFTDILTAIFGMASQDTKDLDVLMDFRIPYEYRNDGQHYKQSRPVVGLPATFEASYRRGKLTKADKLKVLLEDAVFAWSPQFQGKFFSEFRKSTHKRGGAIEEWLRVAKRLRKSFERTDCVYERMLKPGQCAIFDNRRVLHARTAFEVSDAGKERFLKGAYLDRDTWMSRRTVLSEKYPELADELRQKRLSGRSNVGDQMGEKGSPLVRRVKLAYTEDSRVAMP